MSKFKMLFLQTSFISLGIFLAVGIAQTVLHFFGNTYATDWYFLLSVIFAGVLCSLPSLILYNEKISEGSEQSMPANITLKRKYQSVA